MQQSSTDTEDRVRDFEDMNDNLKRQLTTMTQNLLDTEQELNASKSELQNCRQEILVRNSNPPFSHSINPKSSSAFRN